MHEHAATGDAVSETVSAPFLANLGFAFGIVAVILEATIKLAPAAYVIGLVGIVLCGLGFVQGSIQGEAVRVSGAKRDELQSAIALIKKSITDFPLQFNNFRD